MSPPAWNIREFSLDEYNRITDLWRKAGLPFKPEGRDSRASLEKELKLGQGVIFLAVADSRIIGSVLATHDGRKGWINRLAVHPEFRRCSVASSLVKAAETWIEENGIEITACLIEGYNSGSMAFFSAAGYEKHEDVRYFSKRKHSSV